MKRHNGLAFRQITEAGFVHNCRTNQRTDRKIWKERDRFRNCSRADCDFVGTDRKSHNSFAGAPPGFRDSPRITEIDWAAEAAAEVLPEKKPGKVRRAHQGPPTSALINLGGAKGRTFQRFEVIVIPPACRCTLTNCSNCGLWARRRRRLIPLVTEVLPGTWNPAVKHSKRERKR